MIYLVAATVDDTVFKIVVSALTGAIALLWRQVAADKKRCEDRAVEAAKDRAAEQKECDTKIEALHQRLEDRKSIEVELQTEIREIRATTAEAMLQNRETIERFTVAVQSLTDGLFRNSVETLDAIRELKK